MDGTKDWYMSKTVWASAVQIGTGILAGAHYITAAQAATINAEVPGLITSAVVLVAGCIALYGRIVAKKKIA